MRRGRLVGNRADKVSGGEWNVKGRTQLLKVSGRQCMRGGRRRCEGRRLAVGGLTNLTECWWWQGSQAKHAAEAQSRSGRESLRW